MTPAGFTANEDNIDIIVVTDGWDARRVVLKNPKTYGPLAGADNSVYQYNKDAFQEYIRDALGFTAMKDVDTRPIDAINVGVDMMTGVVSMFFSINNQTYFVTACGIEYYAKEAK